MDKRRQNDFLNYIKQHLNIFMFIAIAFLLSILVSITLKNISLGIFSVAIGVLFLCSVRTSYQLALASIKECIGFLLIDSAFFAIVAGLFAAIFIEKLLGEDPSSSSGEALLLTGYFIVALIAICVLYALIGYKAEKRVAVVSFIFISGICALIPGIIINSVQMIPLSALEAFIFSMDLGTEMTRLLLVEYDIRGVISAAVWWLFMPHLAAGIVGAITAEFNKSDIDKRFA